MSVPVAGGRDEGLPVGKPLEAGRPAEESKNVPQAEAERPYALRWEGGRYLDHAPAAAP